MDSNTTRFIAASYREIIKQASKALLCLAKTTPYGAGNALKKIEIGLEALLIEVKRGRVKYEAEFKKQNGI